jgi:hypothetical protein
MRVAGVCVFVAGLALTIAACMPADGKITRADALRRQMAVEPIRSDSDRIISFYDRLLTLNALELVGELDSARQSFDKDGSEFGRLQLALLLSFPGTNFRDDKAAIAMLQPIVKDKGREGSTLRPLATFLQSELLELHRTDEALQQQSAKLKEEQRRVEALQQKLEAILDMEMKMIEREQNLPKKK